MIFQSKLFASIWQRNKSAIAFIYFLNIVEEICYVLVPSAVGMLINTFIYQTGYGVWAFLGVYGGWQGIATLRKILDTITFTKIYNQISLETIEHHKKEGIEISKINARIELLKQVVTFFETDLPFVMNCIVSIIGAAILLYFYNATLLVICLLIVIPSFIINYFFSKKMLQVTEQVNNQYEKQIEVVTNEDMAGIKDYFEKVRQFNIRKSSLEAYNFGTLEFFVCAMIVASIYTICKTPNINYGDIVASYGIILRFAYGFDFIPHITAKLASMKDIRTRLEEVYAPNL
jgi:ABC-type bacteriocin/lantibiotic exporter with double-glycine peptidase domain